MTIVERTCTELSDKVDNGTRPPPSKPLAAYRECSAYVLLGDPGMGKSTAFEQEVKAIGAKAHFITARDFVTFDAEEHPEWRGTTLFIDGLDEMRAGASDRRTPLDSIRRKLDRLGKPRFRLSCRHADWLTIDRRSLGAVSTSGKVEVLRLDPLDEAGVREVLSANPSVNDADAFAGEAKERGMEGLLANPQSLDLLVRAVHAGGWPSSRAETFETACLAMANERNQEHLSVLPVPDPERVLDAAGRVCAGMLVSGVAECDTDPSRANEDHAHIAACSLPDRDARLAVASGLFLHRAEGRIQPIHRHIAEYVAARHIASLIEGGLPALRVIGLMTGSDGMVVSQLRGLSAWLAVRSEAARYDLIERDPIGLGLYGDIEAFSFEEKRTLFQAIAREPQKLEATRLTEPTLRLTEPAFVPLATAAMIGVFEEVFAEPPSGVYGQFVVDFALRILLAAPPLPDLALTLLGIVRDDTRWPRVREAALRAFIQYGGDGDHDADLMDLLRDVRNGRMADPDDQFLGQLLSALYPRRIPPSELWDYAKEPSELIGGYKAFWFHVSSATPDDAIADLMDSCRARLDELEGLNDYGLLGSCFGPLLVRGLQSKGDGLGMARLYNWLDAGWRLGTKQGAFGDWGQSVKCWIAGRPELHFGIFVEGIGRFPTSQWRAPHEAFKRLFGAAVSTAFFESCAEVAKSLAGDHELADALLFFVVQARRLKPESVREIVGDDARLSGALDRMVAPTDEDRLRRADQALVEEQQHRKARERIDRLLANEAALREGRASPALLNELARHYFGFDRGDFSLGFGFGRAGFADKGMERLEVVVQHDAQLLDAVQTALRLTVHRDDVPDAETIIKSRLQGRMHYLCWPYLAGVDLMERTGALAASWWTEQRIRITLTMYFGYGFGNEPRWYQRLIGERTEAVAAVYVQFVSAMFREGESVGMANLWSMAYEVAHEPLARVASLPLLDAFPARAKRDQFEDLNRLLVAAFRHADPTEFKGLIRRKLSRKSMSPGQRGRWLAAGCALATDEFGDDAVAFVESGRQQARVFHFVDFFPLDSPYVFPFSDSNPRLPALLIRLMGRFSFPADDFSDSRELAQHRIVSECRQALASDPSADATTALEELLADPNLDRLHYSLTLAAEEQRVIRRDQQYCAPSIEQVIKALDNGMPAGPGDLAALVLDRLDAIAARIRSDNSDAWKQHWSEDHHGRPTEPKPEESCRNALLSELRHWLPTGVHAEPESLYANRARADIRVSHGEFHVAIELKRNDHRQLWRAAQNQLIAKYTKDPASGGYGIYVVLWFGHDRTQRSPMGRRPDTPDALQKDLEAELTNAQRRTIFVRVVDVS